MRFYLFTILSFLLSGIYAQYNIQEQLRFKTLSIKDGLSSNSVSSICQDKYGRIWIGTKNGINIFDGYKVKLYDAKGNKFMKKANVFADSKGEIYARKPNVYAYDSESGNFNEIFDQDSNSIYSKKNYEDKSGMLWFVSEKGLYVYSPEQNTATKDINFPDSLQFTFIQQDEEYVYFGVQQESLKVYEKQTGKIRNYFTDENIRLILKDKIIRSFFIDDDMVWIGTLFNGLYKYIIKDSVLTKVTIDPNVELIEKINVIFKDSKKNLWISTKDGLYIYEYNKKSFFKYGTHDHLVSVIGNNSARFMFEDKSGILYIGYWINGIYYSNLDKKKIIHYNAKKGNDHFLNNNMVNCINKDKNGNILICTSSGGVNIFNNQTKRFTYLKHQAGNRNSLIHNDVKQIAVDDRNNYWIATYNGLDYYNTATKKFEHYIYDPKKSNNRIYNVLIDSFKNVWIRTTRNTAIMKAGTDNFIPVYHDKINCFFEKKKGELLACDNFNILKFDYDSLKFDVLITPRKNTGRIITFLIVNNNKFWICRERGISYYDSETDFEIDYTNKSLNAIKGLLKDDLNNLWGCSGTGLYRIKPDYENASIKIKSLSISDGLQGYQFTNKAYFNEDNGKMYFGGYNGYNVFDPLDIQPDSSKLEVVFTNLKLFNIEVAVNEEKEGKVILNKSLITTNQLTFNYKQSVFSIEFAAISMESAYEISYAYILEGFDKEWNFVDAKSRNATYSNLDPGEYAFKVKAANKDDLWNDKPSILKIIVLPAWWQTWWFKIIVGLLIGVVVYILARYYVIKEKAKNEKELGLMKLKFFTNIAHEFRTPLALINAPFDRLISTIDLNNRQKTYVNLIHKNTNILNKLIDEFLYFRKNQQEYAKINVSKFDIVYFLKETSSPIQFLANEHHIDFKFQSDFESLQLWFDPDKMVKIINNLLMNAIKFTPSGGEINLHISQVSVKGNKVLNVLKSGNQGTEQVMVTISDTGKGMTKEQAENVFKRYYRVDDKIPGTGIGLSLVNTLVKLHSGDITVESKEGKGSTFHLHFMKGNSHFKKEHINNSLTDIHDFIPEVDINVMNKNENVQVPNEEIIDADIPKESVKPVVMVVDDNADLRNFLKENLTAYYQVISASNGAEAFDKATNTVPDLIISDVDMPKKNGIELCKSIKTNLITSHIPVILLSKKAQIEDEISGLQIGADDYIGKPFNLQSLLLKVKNIISYRQKIKTTVANDPSQKNIDLLESISLCDKEFLVKCKKEILDNLSNTEFTVIDLCESIGLGKSQLQLKLSALVGQSAKEWIYSFRLEEAKSLLTSGKHNVAEVADLVGFSSPNSFGTVFKRKFGVTPNDFVNL